MSKKLKDLVETSPSLKESQILTDEAMSTLEGGCAIICDASCALGCSQSSLWGGGSKPITTTTTTTTESPS